MSYTLEAQLLLDCFLAGWADRTPVAMPGQKFDPPHPAAPWVRLTLLGLDARQVDFGNEDATRHRYPGEMVIQVFDKEGAGDGRLRELGGAACDILRNQVLTDGATQVRIFTPSLRMLGADGKWEQANVRAPFERDTVHTQ